MTYNIGFVDCYDLAGIIEEVVRDPLQELSKLRVVYLK
jgi:hypothetical protein